MHRSTLVRIGVMVLFACAGKAGAHVSSGSNCASCHTATTGRATIDSSLTTDATNDPGVPAGLKKFVAYPGGSVKLAMTVTNGGATGAQYAVALTGLTSATTDGGVLNAAHTLTFTQDATWTARGSGSGSYATRGPFNWSGNATGYNYAMNVSTTSPLDYYLLGFTAAGSSGGRWCQPQNFVLQIALGGDANLDGKVDVSDLGALATNWQTNNTWSGGDFNNDGFVDVTDLGVLATNWQAGVASPPVADSFEAALARVGLGGAIVPEPATTGAMLALLALSRRRRRA